MPDYILNPEMSILHYANNRVLWKLKYYTGFTELHTSPFFEGSIIYVFVTLIDSGDTVN